MSHSANRIDPVAPRSRFYHGPFGRLFSTLPPWGPGQTSADELEKHFLDFVKETMVEVPGKSSRDIAEDEDTRKSLDAQFNSKIPAGYTYFGQFIDHDLTFDPTPLGQSAVDPGRLHNFRTPRLDLDCVYGRGPADQPYLYEHETGSLTGKFLISQLPETDFFDLPRNSEERALIGDMRNDENALVAQIQLAFLTAHNKLVDFAKEQNERLAGSSLFRVARRTLTWLYQWVVWKDFLQRITLGSTHQMALTSEPLVGGGIGEIWRLGLQDLYNWKNQPFMPVEFSVAAYRFGHSMVRNSYQTNVSKDAGFREFIALFDKSENADDLRGFRALNQRRVVQWDWFLEMGNPDKDLFPQRARKIDTKLSNALAELPDNPTDPNSIDNILAARNLVRGVRMKLPSGPDVARKLGLTPISLDADEPQSLWYYVLKEAETEQGGERLGNVGSLILCATFAGILKGDPASWVNMEPAWTPDTDPLLKDRNVNVDGENNAWTLASIIRLSGLPISGSDISGTTPTDGEQTPSPYSGGERRDFDRRGPGGKVL